MDNILNMEKYFQIQSKYFSKKFFMRAFIIDHAIFMNVLSLLDLGNVVFENNSLQYKLHNVFHPGMEQISKQRK